MSYPYFNTYQGTQPYQNPYQPYQPPIYPQQMQANTQAQNTPVQQPAPQIQNGGFISVRSEMEARNYPVAPGNSITFKDENTPYVYVKTMGFSQLDRPVFERFRLVKEEETPTQNPVQATESAPIQQARNDTAELLKGEINALRAAYGQLKNEVESLKANFDTTDNKSASKLTKESDEE